MKKSIFILTILMSFMFANSQNNLKVDSLLNKIKPNININVSDSAVSQLKGLVPDSTLPFYKEVYSDLKAGSLVIANGLGVAIKDLFDILCVQQLVKAITNIAFMVFAIFFLVWAYRLGKKVEWHGESDRVSARAFWCVLIGLIGLFFMIWTFATINQTVTGFVNPKYGAIKDIVSMASEISTKK